MAGGIDKKLGGGGHKQEAFDKATGRYVSSNSTGVFPIFDKLHLKTGIKLNVQDFKSKEIEKANKTPIFASVSEAEKFANDALAKYRELGQPVFSDRAVHFSHNCDLKSAQEMAEAIIDVSKDFPKIMKNLVDYGDSRKERLIPNDEKIHKVVMGVLKEHIDKYGKESSTDYDQMTMSTFLFSLNNTIYQNSKMFKKNSYVSGTTTTMKSLFSNYAIPLNIISFNQSGTQHYDQYKIEVDKSIANKSNNSYGNKGFMYGISTHELGHFVDNNMGYLGFKGDEKDYMKKLYKEIMKNSELRNQVSKYAQTNSKELLAEAFCDWYCNKEHAQPINIQIFNFIKKVYDREFGGK